MSALTEDDLFFFNAAEKLEQEYQRRKQDQLPVPPKPEMQPVFASAPQRSTTESANRSSAQQLPPEIVKRIEANRAAAQARLHQAASNALLAHDPLPSCTVAPRAASGSESDAESCSSQASITSYFKPNPCSSCSQPCDTAAGSCGRRRQQPLSEVNGLPPPSSPVSSQQSICSISAANSSRSFQPFALSSESQSQSRRLLCAACGELCCGSSGCVLQYPEHPPLREYQRQLVCGCITRNTLIILPTGLGKTFIAGFLF
jgi:hypothetical protein